MQLSNHPGLISLDHKTVLFGHDFNNLIARETLFHIQSDQFFAPGIPLLVGDPSCALILRRVAHRGRHEGSIYEVDWYLSKFDLQVNGNQYVRSEIHSSGQPNIKSMTVLLYIDMRSRIRLASQREIAVAHVGSVSCRG